MRILKYLNFCFRRSGTWGITPLSKVDLNVINFLFSLSLILKSKQMEYSKHECNYSSCSSTKSQRLTLQLQSYNKPPARSSSRYVSVTETPNICFFFLTVVWTLVLIHISPKSNRQSIWSPKQGFLEDQGLAAGVFVLVY